MKEGDYMSELIRYDWPGTSLAPMFEDFFADGFFNRWDRDFSGTLWPRVDIIERPESFLLKADLPGLEKGDISISVDNRTLTISGKKEETKRETKKGSYYHLERGFGSFCRSFTLPSHVDDKKVEAHFKNGVLELILKKTGEAVSKAIEVKVD
jgi:HSP20 family protein